MLTLSLTRLEIAVRPTKDCQRRVTSSDKCYLLKVTVSLLMAITMAKMSSNAMSSGVWVVGGPGGGIAKQIQALLSFGPLSKSKRLQIVTAGSKILPCSSSCRVVKPVETGTKREGPSQCRNLSGRFSSIIELWLVTGLTLQQKVVPARSLIIVALHLSIKSAGFVRKHGQFAYRPLPPESDKDDRIASDTSLPFP